MTSTHPSLDQSGGSCATDRSCAHSGCGCSTKAVTGQGPATSGRGIKAGVIALACALGCLGVPLAIGGVAVVSGAMDGEWWLLVGIVVGAIVVGVAVVRRRRTGRLC